MTSRTTTTLAIVTTLLALYVFVLDKDGPPPQGRSFRVVQVAAAADIIELEISGTGAGRIALRRSADGGWMMTAPLADRADAEKVDELVRSLLELKTLEVLEGDDTPADSAMGLAANALTISLRGEGGEALGTLALGDPSAVEAAIYARWEDSPPILCWKEVRELADVPSNALRDAKLLGIPVESMRRVKVEKDNTMASFVIDRPGENAPWQITKPLKTGADPEAVDERLALIANMAAEGFIDNPNGDVATAFAGDSITVSVWRLGERGSVNLQLAKSPDGQSAFAKASDRAGVFSIDPEFLDAIGLNPNDLRDRRLAHFNPKSVAGIEIDAKPNFHVSLLLGDNGWRVVESAADSPGNRLRIAKMLKALALEKVLDFVADAVGDLAPYGLDDPTLTISLTTIAQDAEQPTNDDGSPKLISVPMTLLVKRFQPADQPATKLYATIKDSGTIVELDPSFHELVPVRANDFKSLYLWPAFSLASLRELTVAPGVGGGLELEYLDDTNKWVGKLGGADVSDRIDDLAVLKLVQHLSLPLSATRWLGGDTSDAQRALLEPALRIEFELRDAAGKTFPFGIDIAPISNTIRNTRNAFYYGRVHGNNAICLIDGNHVALFAKPLLKSEPSPAPE